MTKARLFVFQRRFRWAVATGIVAYVILLGAFLAWAALIATD